MYAALGEKSRTWFIDRTVLNRKSGDNIGAAMPAPSPTLRSSLFRPGQRIAVAVSGGADSVALLRRLLEERHTLGIVLSVVHVHHGIREASEEESAFVAALAAAYNLP